MSSAHTHTPLRPLSRRIEVAKAGHQQVLQVRDYTLGMHILPGGKEEHGNILRFLKTELAAWSISPERSPEGKLHKWYNKIYVTADRATAVVAALNHEACKDLVV